MRKKKHPEHVNHERWLVSYADFITLLFAFFTTLYAISTVDAQKAGRLVQSVRASFNSPMFSPGSDTLSLSKGEGSGTMLKIVAVENVSPSKSNPVKGANVNPPKFNYVANTTPKGEVIALGLLQRKVDSIVTQRGVGGKVRTRLDSQGLVISLDGTFFNSGDDRLNPDGIGLMDALAADLGAQGRPICIEGHTDNIPISTSRFPTNWELSAARATSIVVYLIRNFNFPPDRISGTGFAEYRPIADNNTVEGRARNRRVNIVVLNPTAVHNAAK